MNINFTYFLLKFAIITMCDLNKAFDCVNHHRLTTDILKLENLFGQRKGSYIMGNSVWVPIPYFRT